MTSNKVQEDKQQFIYCHNNNDPQSLIMLDIPDKIPRLIFYSPEDTMFIWILSQLSHNGELRSLKARVQNKLKLFIIGKETIEEVEKQFEQCRTTGNVVIICSPELYEQASNLKHGHKQIKTIICFTNDPQFDPDENYQFVVTNNQQQLIGFISQDKVTSPTAKILPNFLFLSVQNKMTEVFKSNSISNMLFAMLNCKQCTITTNKIIDQLEKVVEIMQEENLSYKVKREKTKNFLADLRVGLSLEETLRWYTQDTVVNKLLNNLLRSANHPTEIFYIQPYFKRLFNSISQIYRQQNAQPRSPFKCYRGSKITEEELKKFKENEGKFVQNLFFLSTSLDFEIAKTFCQNVIFEIQIFPHEIGTEIPFDYGYAEISKLSKFLVEAQILFNPLNIFKIVGLGKESQSSQIIIVKLQCRRAQESSGKSDFLLEEQKIIAFNFEQKKKVNLQGYCFSQNFDLFGSLSYWQKYLQIANMQTEESLFLKMRKIQAMLRIAKYHTFIGSIKEPLRAIEGIFRVIFGSDIQAYLNQRGQIQEIISRMSQQEYSLYGLVINELAYIWGDNGLNKKSIQLIQKFLFLAQKLGRSLKPEIFISQFEQIHLNTNGFSSAPKIYQQYFQNYHSSQGDGQPAESKKALLEIAKGPKQLVKFAKSYEKILSCLTTQQYSSFLIKLGLVYQEMGCLREAIQKFQKQIFYLSLNSGKEDVRVQQLTKWLSHLTKNKSKLIVRAKAKHIVRVLLGSIKRDTGHKYIPNLLSPVKANFERLKRMLEHAGKVKKAFKSLSKNSVPFQWHAYQKQKFKVLNSKLKRKILISKRVFAKCEKISML